jgi:hypothetical protein
MRITKSTDLIENNRMKNSWADNMVDVLKEEGRENTKD